ncbi:MAG: hypothetical protein WBM11_11510 [Terriglobales bacterium]
MKRFGTAIMLSMALVLFACGGGPTTGGDALKGNWDAGLFNPNQTQAFSFTATLTQTGTTVFVTKFTFATPSPCFGLGTVANGVFTPTSTTNGVTSGTLQMTFQSDPFDPEGTNTLSLQGTLVRNVISGSWKLSQPDSICNVPGNSTSGSFTMLPMSQMPTS